MPIPCNMDEEERAGWFRCFDGFLTDEEDRQARRIFTQYLFYETWGRRNIREYYCPACGRFEVQRGGRRDIYQEDPFQFHHGDAGNCPLCGEEAVYIALGRMGREMKSIREWRNIAVIRACRGALLISAGTATRRYDRFEDLDPAVGFDETRRYVVMPGKRAMWTRPSACFQSFGREYWRTRREGWTARKTFTEPFPATHCWGYGIRRGELYLLGAENIEKSGMKYCQLAEFVRDCWGQDLYWQDGYPCQAVRGAIAYLGEYSRRPQLEMLHKLGHDDFINTLLERGSLDRRLVDWRKKTPAEFFRMSREEYRLFRERGGRIGDLTAWRTHEVRQMSFREHCGACEFLGGWSGEFFTLCGKLELGEREALRYLRKQAEERHKGSEVFQTWRDYLDLAEKLGRDMAFRRTVYPGNLWEEHDAAAVLADRLQKREENEKYGPRFRRLKRRYAWTDGEYQILVPLNTTDIEQEGKALRHCVAGYAPRHMTGATTILFLRKCDTPRERYVTIELREPDHIVQVRGYRNDRDKPEAERPARVHAAFLAEWLDWVRAGSPRHKNGRPVKIHKRKKEKTA